MITRLTLLPVDDPKAPVETTELPVVIGRSDGVHVRVACRWASRRHCEIDRIDGEFVLRDLGSRYGTIVNGQPVQQVVLRPGDQIRVGLRRFVVELANEMVGIEHSSEAEFDGEPV